MRPVTALPDFWNAFYSGALVAQGRDRTSGGRAPGPHTGAASAARRTQVVLRRTGARQRLRPALRPICRQALLPRDRPPAGRDGWLGVGWPEEYGGRGMTPMEQFIFFDEAARAGVPLPLMALNTVGPTIKRSRSAPPRSERRRASGSKATTGGSRTPRSGSTAPRSCSATPRPRRRRRPPRPARPSSGTSTCRTWTPSPAGRWPPEPNCSRLRPTWPYGARQSMLRDPFGHVWIFLTPLSG
ncbi:acyl-CoA dehydrogenase family protein [Actinacidiphila glaucinigra]|uniref:acyl-CoA dehydrogenase family protein n=1 Tax=Actinacidiphila glaucinigra TaxID=235986 RepID=UPI00381316F7